VPEPVSADPSVQAGPVRQSGHHAGHTVAIQRSVGPDRGQEHLPVNPVVATVGPQIGGQGFADLGGQRHELVILAFAGDAHSAGAPVQIIQAELGDLSRPQPEPGKQ